MTRPCTVCGQQCEYVTELPDQPFWRHVQSIPDPPHAAEIRRREPLFLSGVSRTWIGGAR